MTATSDDGVRAIRERARDIASYAGVEERCPATVPNGKVVVVNTPRGATITLKSKRPEDTRSLQRTVHQRAEDYSPPVVK